MFHADNENPPTPRVQVGVVDSNFRLEPAVEFMPQVFGLIGMARWVFFRILFYLGLGLRYNRKDATRRNRGPQISGLRAGPRLTKPAQP